MIGDDSTESRSTAADLVMRFYHRLWNAWDDAAVETTLSRDVIFRESLGRTAVGRDGWRSYRDDIRRGAADFHNEVLTLIAHDDRAAARLRFTGTHRRPLLGISATGRTFAYSGAAFFTTAGPDHRHLGSR